MKQEEKHQNVFPGTKRTMTKKEEYIGAFLDGYFADKKLPEYNMQYIYQLDIATELAKKKWKKYKKQKL